MILLYDNRTTPGLRSAKHSIALIDNYIDDTTLIHLVKKKKGVKVVCVFKDGQRLDCKRYQRYIGVDITGYRSSIGFIIGGIH